MVGSLYFTSYHTRMYSFSEILQIVNDAVATSPFNGSPKGLYEPIRYVLSLGGKRIRPVLMLMGYNLYQDNVKSILGPAIGIETYHNYTLLHDDLMDRADVRRGKPCVHKVWNENTAILSGDAMLVLAYQQMALCDPCYLSEVMGVFTKTALEIDEGQQFDMDFETRNDVTEEEYIEMIRLKTSVLLACALKIGAILAGAPNKDLDALYTFGERIGLAFQLQDDYLDVYGNSVTFGKKIGGDILCNKKTFMLINALRKATPVQRQELQKWLDATNYDKAEKIKAVTQLYSSIGVDKLAQQRINEYYGQAKEALAQVSLPAERKQILWEFAMQLLNRES